MHPLELVLGSNQLNGIDAGDIHDHQWVAKDVAFGAQNNLLALEVGHASQHRRHHED